MARRLLFAPFILLGATFTVFVMIDLAPSDPAYARLGITATQEMRADFAAAHGLDDPLLIRFWRFVADLIRLDFGESAVRAETVGELLGRALPVSLQLMMLSIALATSLALLLGVGAAWAEGRWPDRMISGVVAVIHAAPEFWIGLLFIQLFAVEMRLLPSGGYSTISDGLSAWLLAMLGPSIVLALGIMATLARVIRASMADELSKDYVITARGTGLPWPTVLFRNVLRNALITPITVLGVIVGALMSGAVLVETVFNLPGMGALLVNGVNSGDLGVVRGVTIVAAATFVVSNLVVDLVNAALSPRSVEASTR